MIIILINQNQLELANRILIRSTRYIPFEKKLLDSYLKLLIRFASHRKLIPDGLTLENVIDKGTSLANITSAMTLVIFSILNLPSSEKRDLSSTFCSGEMLQNLPYL